MELTIKLQFKVILQILLDFTVSFAFQLNRAHEEAINSVAVTESSIVFTASVIRLWVCGIFQTRPVKRLYLFVGLCRSKISYK
uniref:Secreted protein n=1 Tax=Ascaris lumbricoides TaxID=6252 RepID=A0A0M3IMD3_ASCLU